MQCCEANSGGDVQTQQIINTASDQNKETEAVRFYKGVDLFDLGFVKDPEDAGKKLRKKLWSTEGLVNTMISPTKANEEQREAATPQKVAQFKGLCIVYQLSFLKKSFLIKFSAFSSN